MGEAFWLSDEAWAAIAPLLPHNQPGARRRERPKARRPYKVGPAHESFDLHRTIAVSHQKHAVAGGQCAFP